MKGKTLAKTDGKIFIGHGGSKVWRDLKDFLQDRLNLTEAQRKQVKDLQQEVDERLGKVLTDEQRQQLKELRERGPGGFGGFGGGKGPGKGPGKVPPP